MEVAIVTDSTADLEVDTLEKYDITMIPLQVTVNDTEYLDMVELKPEEFLAELEDAEQMPTTSQPPLGKFIEVYEELAAEYDYIISIHISGAMSGTVKTANTASNMVEGAKIEVIDSQTVTIPLGVIVTEVAKAAQRGQSMEDLLDLITRLKEQVTIYFTVDELDYLEKGGRIGKATAFLGNLLKIRPLLTIEDSEIAPYKKVRGQRRLYKHFLKLAGQTRTSGSNNLIILYGQYEDKAQILREQLTERYDWDTVQKKRFGSVVGAHIGPTPYGMIIW
ncbi:MAG: DegV family protein [Bacillota bacterium]